MQSCITTSIYKGIKSPHQRIYIQYNFILKVSYTLAGLWLNNKSLNDDLSRSIAVGGWSFPFAYKNFWACLIRSFEPACNRLNLLINVNTDYRWTYHKRNATVRHWLKFLRKCILWITKAHCHGVKLIRLAPCSEPRTTYQPNILARV